MKNTSRRIAWILAAFCLSPMMRINMESASLPTRPVAAMDSQSMGFPNRESSRVQPVQLARLDATPRGFIPNKGQMPNETVKFALRDQGLSAYFTDRGFVLWTGHATTNLQDGRETRVPVAPRWELVGANPVVPLGGDALAHTVSYFRGNDPARWRSNLPAFRDLRYPEVLKGVEMRVESRDHGFEYSFHVQPFAKPELRFRYEGIAGLSLTSAGDLVVKAASGQFTESRPITFQWINGKRRDVESHFEILSDTEYRIVVGSYDGNHTLVVDPVLDWSTFLGGSQSDSSKTLKVDPQGFLIVAGNTFSTDLPETPSGFGTGPGVNSSGGTWYRDAYVAKFSPDGTQLVWSGYLGGNGPTDEELGWKSLAVDSAGDVYVGGFTMSPDFPVTMVTPHAGALDAFVTKIKSDGSQILWSRLIGGAAEDWSSGVALDPSGDLFVTGYTRSSDLPVTPLASFDQTLGGTQDVFVAKLTAASGGLLWCSYLGGSQDERVVSVAATLDGGAVVFGDTASADFPTVGAFQPSFGGVNDAFVTKVSGNGTSLVWSTFLGGSGQEHDQLINTSDPFPASWAKGDVTVDSEGSVVVVGQTYSSNFPTTPGAFQTVLRGNNDGYVTKLSSNGGLLWSSYLGGAGPADPDGREEVAWAVTVNPWDEIFVGGWTQSIDFPTTADALKPSQSNAVRYDGFLVKLNSAGSQLLYSSYIGGYENNDVVLGIAYDQGSIYLSGWATAASFPTTSGAFQESCVSCETPNLWAADGHVMKFLDAFVAHDGFESGNFTGGNGGWVAGWLSSGDTSIQTAAVPHSGTRHVRLRRSTGLLQRTINMSGVVTARLGFWGKVSSFEGVDKAEVKVNGTPVATFTLTHSDGLYHYYDLSLDSFLPASQIQIAFDAGMDSTGDNWYLDDIRVTGTSEPVPPVANAGADLNIVDTDNSGAESVTLDGAASFDPDGGGIVDYEWKEGAVVLGHGVSLNTVLTVGIHLITLKVTDDEGATASDTVQVTVAAPPPPPANPLHVGDMDGSSANSGKYWKATVVITVHDGNHVPVAGATVFVLWSGGASGTSSASTDANGRCTLVSGNLSKQLPTATLAVTGVTHSTLTYSNVNHDPDGDSTGTVIVVSKP